MKKKKLTWQLLFESIKAAQAGTVAVRGKMKALAAKETLTRRKETNFLFVGKTSHF